MRPARAGFGTGPDNRVKILVESDAELLLLEAAANVLADMEILDEERHAFLRRPPFLRPDMSKGIEAHGVGRPKHGHAQLARDTGKTVGPVQVPALGSGSVRRVRPNPA